MTDDERLPPEKVDEIAARHIRPLWREPFVWLGAAVAILAALMLAAYTHAVDSASRRPCQPHDHRGACIAAAQANAAASKANARLSQHGLPQVATPTNIPVPTVTVTLTGPPGPEGPAGPSVSSEDLQSAVAAYCGLQRCIRGPTAAQVAQAVATFCHADGHCVGSAGPEGPQGARGPAGQNATADQIADAVTTYCDEHDGCTGPTGPEGPTGAVGPTGPAGPPGPTCTDGHHLAEQTVLTTAGPVVVEMCVADAQPSPTPSGGPPS